MASEIETFFTKLIKSGDFVVLDTETTGKELNSRICQIAIIDSSGAPLLDTLVNPGVTIRNSFIHGITDEMVKDAPPIRDLLIQIFNRLHSRTVLIYNAGYDVPVLMNEFEREKLIFPTIDSYCAMLAYADYYGEWDDWHGNNRWQKLTNAAAQIGYKLPQGINAHSALGDCLMTLAVCRHMAGIHEEQS